MSMISQPLGQIENSSDGHPVIHLSDLISACVLVHASVWGWLTGQPGEKKSESEWQEVNVQQYSGGFTDYRTFSLHSYLYLTLRCISTFPVSVITLLSFPVQWTKETGNYPVVQKTLANRRHKALCSLQTSACWFLCRCKIYFISSSYIRSTLCNHLKYNQKTVDEFVSLLMDAVTWSCWLSLFTDRENELSVYLYFY